MKTLILTIVLTSFSLVAFSQVIKSTIESDTLTTTGLIHQKPFVDKGGNPNNDAMYFWFKTGENDYFIKLYASKISSDTLKKYIDKTVCLTYVIKKGEWDSTGKEPIPIQSRVGKYIAVFKLNPELAL